MSENFTESLAWWDQPPELVRKTVCVCYCLEILQPGEEACELHSAELKDAFFCCLSINVALYVEQCLPAGEMRYHFKRSDVKRGGWLAQDPRARCQSNVFR